MVKISIAAKMTTRIKGQSEKEREGYRNNEAGTVSFLRLPFLILGGVGGAVECRVLHRDTGVDERNNK